MTIPGFDKPMWLHSLKKDGPRGNSTTTEKAHDTANIAA